MRFLVVLLIFLLSYSCEDERKIGDIKNLNGYWQIKKAEIPDIVVKNYKGGLKLNYIEIKDDSTGIRKKIKVSMLDKFKTTPNQEEIRVFTEGEDLKIQCKTPYSKWTEKILHLSNDSLVIRNQDDKKYYYSKYQLDKSYENEPQ